MKICNIIIPSLFFLFTGCASHYQGYGPQLSAFDNHIRKIAIINPDLYVFDVSGGGVPEFRIDWTRQAEYNLGEALKAQLGRIGADGMYFADMQNLPAIDAIVPFVKFTATIIQRHLYGNNPFLNQLDSFEYSTGPLLELCNYLQVDAVMFVFGSDENFSDLHKTTLKKSVSVKNVKSVIAAILLGPGNLNIYSIPLERTFICCLIADNNGKVIWYRQYLKSDGSDLRKTSDASKIARQVLNGLSFRKKQ